MKVKSSILLITSISLICFITVSSFTKNGLQQPGLKQQLIGEWRNIALRIKRNINDKVKPAVVEADSTNWETKLGIKPIRTHFKNDGSYYSEYFNLKDSLIRRTSGTWSIKNDSLTMVQLLPDKSNTKLHVSINNNVATFTGIIDFDGNGKLDDDYFGKQKKFSAKP
ncbi:hypothetical protein GCM10027049_22410 [Mucilaginibacter puniceus]